MICKYGDPIATGACSMQGELVTIRCSLGTKQTSVWGSPRLFHSHCGVLYSQIYGNGGYQIWKPGRVCGGSAQLPLQYKQVIWQFRRVYTRH